MFLSLCLWVGLYRCQRDPNAGGYTFLLGINFSSGDAYLDALVGLTHLHSNDRLLILVERNLTPVILRIVKLRPGRDHSALSKYANVLPSNWHHDCYLLLAIEFILVSLHSIIEALATCFNIGTTTIGPWVRFWATSRFYYGALSILR